MSLRAVLLLLSLSTFGLSKPAHAGRASACKAPPFSVPKETQRAVDAAIDARVVGTGAGAVSSTVETRTDYETTTLSQDAAARSWVEYTLCLKLAKKLISQDLHDDLLRGLLTPSARPAEITGPLAEPAEPPVAVAPSTAVLAPVETLAGTWQVVSRYTHGSCPKGADAQASAYSWLVSISAAGEVEVAVQGRTTYPVLSGSWSDGHLRVGGTARENGVPAPAPYLTATDGRPIMILPRADFDLELTEGGQLTGSRQFATWSSRMTDDGGGWLIEPCTLNYEVSATR